MMKIDVKNLKKEKYVFIALFLIILHFVFLMFFFKPAISTPDAQGYFIQGKEIATRCKTNIEPQSILQYLGPHWLNSGDNSYFTSFPPGFPVIIAFFYKIFGVEAAFLINPILASLSLLGLFFVCRLWIGKGWGLFAIVLMFVNPTFNEHALYGDSHISVIFFLIWALYFLISWIKTNSLLWSFLVGLFIGIIPTIRYSEFIFTIAFIIFIILNLKKLSKNSIFSATVGFLIPVIALSIRNQLAFGGFWKTGYGLAQESHFAFLNIINNAIPYLQKLIFEGLGIVFILGVIGIILMYKKKELRIKAIFFTLLIIPITLLYMSYFWKPDPQSMRFLLPTFLIYVITTIWMFSLIKDKKLTKIFLTLLLVITVFWGFPQSILMMKQQKDNNEHLTLITKRVKREIEKNNIIITYEGIAQQLDLIGDWYLADISILSTILPKPHSNAPSVRSSPQRPLRNLDARERYSDLRDNDLYNMFKKDILSWAGNNKKVYFLIKENYLTELEKFKLSEDQFIIIDSFIVNKEEQSNFLNLLKPPGGKPQIVQTSQPNQRLTGPNQIYDLNIDEKPYYIVEWIINND